MSEQYRERVTKLYEGVDALDLAMRVVDAEDEAARLRSAWMSARLRARRQVENFRGWRASIYEVARSSFRAAGTSRRSANRYRLAWISARRRAADEANLGMEALELKAAEIAQLRRRLAELEAPA